ncbi:MAG: hypothetical protein ACRD6W_02520 [Nitrososphaerales archaeon]
MFIGAAEGGLVVLGGRLIQNDDGIGGARGVEFAAYFDALDKGDGSSRM